MHGVPATTSLPAASTAALGEPMADMATVGLARPGPSTHGADPLHQHSPSLTGHHGCTATLSAGHSIAAPAAFVITLPIPTVAGASSVATTTAAQRAPPDLNELCVSRT
jgi:hypothetical protein